RRQQPLRPPRIKPRQRHPPLLLQLPDQQPRDQEPRDHKENINPHKPTRKHLHHTRVIDQHQPNRNSPQPLNIRPKTPTPTTNTTRMPAALARTGDGLDLGTHQHLPSTGTTRRTVLRRPGGQDPASSITAGTSWSAMYGVRV